MKRERVILGIDPGTNVMGFGVVKATGAKVQVLHLDVLKLRTNMSQTLKLKSIFDFCLSLTEQYLPDEMAVEAPFYGKNVQSMLKLGRAQGVIMAAALHRNIPIEEYSPRKIKQSITGNGNASKEQVAVLLEKIFAQSLQGTYLDATDGLAVALCHHYQSESSHLRNPQKAGSWSAYLRQNPEKRA